MTSWVCPMSSTTALAEASPKGRCFATWQCQPLAGSANSSTGSLEECCAQPWGHSWWDSSSQMCHSCAGQQHSGGSAVSRPSHSPSLALKSSRPFHQALPTPVVPPEGPHPALHTSCCDRNCVLSSVPAVRGSYVTCLAQAMLPPKPSCSLWEGL